MTMFNRRNAPRRLSAMAGYIGLMRRAVLRGPRSSPVTVDFLRMDTALPDFITFGRADASPCATRRRITGSVGPSRTNYLRNSTAQSGAAGAMPTFWSNFAGGAGLTYTINGLVVANGKRYMDLSISGTATATAYPQFGFDGVTPASAGEVWTQSQEVQVIGGSTAGFVTWYTAPAAKNGGANVNQKSTGFTPDGAMKRYSSTITAGATTTHVVTVFGFQVTNGSTVDIRILVGQPQFEKGDAVTPQIDTSGAAVTTTDWPRTNKCRNKTANAEFNASVSIALQATNGLATLSVVDDTAALEAAGLHGICTSGRVYKFDNSLGDSTATMTFEGEVSSLAPHSASCFMRGTGDAELRINALSALTSLTATYARRKTENVTPIGTTRDSYISLGAGGVCYAILNQLEEGAAATAVIPNDTGAAKTVTTPPYGDLEVVAADKPRIGYTTDGLPRGLLIEPVRTNKCLNYNADPSDLTNMTTGGDAAAVFSVVEDDAAIAAAGLSGVCASGKVYKIDNSVGTTTAWVYPGGNTANTNVHTGSAYVRGGTGALLAPGTTVLTAFAASSAYQRVTGTFTPGSTTNVIRIAADAGQTVYFILNQLEEGGSVTSPILANGTQRARAAEAAVVTNLASINWNVGGWSAMLEWEQGALGVVGKFGHALALNDNTNSNQLGFFQNSTGGIYTNNTAGGVTSWINVQLGTVAPGGKVRLAFSVTASGIVASVNGGAPTTVPGVVAMAAFTRAVLCANKNGDVLDGYLRRFKAWNRALTQGELQQQSAL